ncbi:hypothetical protein GCM10027320_22400 [Massilia solisilvae]
MALVVSAQAETHAEVAEALAVIPPGGVGKLSMDPGLRRDDAGKSGGCFCATTSA